IQTVNADGTVSCQSVGTVTSVTASAPLFSTGGTTPNIILPNVIISQPFTIGNSNTAIGAHALTNNSGQFNTATGTFALSSNTSGTNNTASGSGALFSNTTGINNTATGADALASNT